MDATRNYGSESKRCCFGWGSGSSAVLAPARRQILLLARDEAGASSYHLDAIGARPEGEPGQRPRGLALALEKQCAARAGFRPSAGTRAPPRQQH